LIVNRPQLELHLQTEFTCLCFLVSLSSILGVWVTLDMFIR
jgi:hypothetical protein